MRNTIVATAFSIALLWLSQLVAPLASQPPLTRETPPMRNRYASALFLAGQPDGGGPKSIVQSAAHAVPPGMGRIILADRGGGLGFNGQPLPQWTDANGDFDWDNYTTWAQGRIQPGDTLLLDVEREDWLANVPRMIQSARENTGCTDVGFYAFPMLPGYWPTADAIKIAGALPGDWALEAAGAADFVSPCIYPVKGEGLNDFRRRVASEVLAWRMRHRDVRPIGCLTYSDPGLHLTLQQRCDVLNEFAPVEYHTAQAQVMHACGGGVWWGTPKFVVWQKPGGPEMGVDGSLDWRVAGPGLLGIVRHFEAAAQESAATAPLTP